MTARTADNNWQHNFAILSKAQVGKRFRCPGCNNVMDVLKNYRKKTKDLRCRLCGTETKKPIVEEISENTRRKKTTVQTHELWDRYKLAKKLKTYRMKEFERNFIGSERVIRDLALVAMLFLTGGRVSELVGIYKPRKNRKLPKEYTVEPLRRKQIEFGLLEGIKYMEIKNLPVLKKYKKFSKTGKEMETEVVSLSGLTMKKIDFRNVIIDIESEKEFYRYIKEWLDVLPQDPETPIFSCGRQNAWLVTRRIDIKVFNHFFRHMRATDLLNYYGFSEQPTKLFFNWASTATVSRYSHISKIEILSLMVSGRKRKEQEKKDLKDYDKKEEEDETKK